MLQVLQNYLKSVLQTDSSAQGQEPGAFTAANGSKQSLSNKGRLLQISSERRAAPSLWIYCHPVVTGRQEQFSSLSIRTVN